ncbi:hypothetical protein HKX42_05860 [Salinisphaera sp. USBA-960]|nr:hypothetical protein [Salifodinibacter halophilus]NNC26397.1 hypothetical protein [Salifodinibacter halophilus]
MATTNTSTNHHRGLAISLAFGRLCLAIVAAVLSLVANFLAAVMASESDNQPDDDQNQDGWDCGSAGPGFYISGIRQDD